MSFDARQTVVLFTQVRVTEEPFKIPYYAALIRLLHERTEEPSSTPSIGRQLLEDFWKGFQAYLDKLAWRETRLCVTLLSFN
jgi:nuclear cap-binding protein subunit 1